MPARHHLSNISLMLGAVLLAAVGLMEFTGGQIDPMIPAFSALFIGSTAVLDRIGVGEIK